MKPAYTPPTPERFVPIVTRLDTGQYYATEAWKLVMEWAPGYDSESGNPQFREAPPVPSDVWGQS